MSTLTESALERFGSGMKQCMSQFGSRVETIERDHIEVKEELTDLKAQFNKFIFAANVEVRRNDVNLAYRDLVDDDLSKKQLDDVFVPFFRFILHNGPNVRVNGGTNNFLTSIVKVRNLYVYVSDLRSTKKKE